MNFSRLFAFVATALAATIALSAGAQTKPALSPTAQRALAEVHEFIAAFNAGDVPRMIATCAQRASIIDDIPPHEWHGSDACGQWARDLAAAEKKAGISDSVVTLGAAWRVDVDGPWAYVVTPATYTYRVHGKPVTETNSTFTVALQRTGGAWRITGWTWSAH